MNSGTEDNASANKAVAALEEADEPPSSSEKDTDIVSKSNVTVGTLEDAKNSDRGGNNKNGESPKRFVYCDFAKVEEEEYDVDYEIDQEGLLQALEESTAMAAQQTIHHQNARYLSQPPPVLRASGWVRSQRFPVKLYALLSQPQLSHIIAWMPHGRSWKVIQPRIFETSVLPVFFESDNYHSFNRVINAWSFRRKSHGADRGSYFHELFLRGKPHLQKYMRRLPRTHKKLAMSKEDEPDFFALDKTSPLPSLEEARVRLEKRKMRRLREHFEKDTVVRMAPSKLQPMPGLTSDRSKQHNLDHQSLKQAESVRENQYSRQFASARTTGASPHDRIEKDDAKLPAYAAPDARLQELARKAQEEEELQLHRTRQSQANVSPMSRQEHEFMTYQQHQRAQMMHQADFAEQEHFRRIRDLEYVRDGQQFEFHRQMNMMHAAQQQNAGLAALPYGGAMTYPMGHPGANPYYMPPP